MLTIIEYASLAQDVYQGSSSPLLPAIDFKSLKKNKTGQYGIQHKHYTEILNGFYRFTDVDVSQHVTSPFFCQLYIKFEQGKAMNSVVAYRGTANWDNLVTDFDSWHGDIIYNKVHKEYLPRYKDLAAIYYAKTRQYIYANFPELVNKMTYTTGHSLGGALAALVIVSCAFPGLAITFNAPGVACMPGADKDLFGRVYNVEARYDFISKIGEQCRPARYIDVPQMETQAKAAFENKIQANQMEQLIARGENSFTAMNDQQYVAEIEGAATAEMALSLMAQHKMKNVFAALSLDGNKAVAYTMPT